VLARSVDARVLMTLRNSSAISLVDDQVLVLDGSAVDVDVTFGKGASLTLCRMVGVPTPDGTYRFYLTNLPPAVGPLQIADLYRVRWEIESDNKLDKSCSRLDQIAARTGPSVRAMVHASMVSSIIACVLAHHVRLDEAPPPRHGTERLTASIHPQSLARAMGSAAGTIAAAMDLPGNQQRASGHALPSTCHIWAEIPTGAGVLPFSISCAGGRLVLADPRKRAVLRLPAHRSHMGAMFFVSGADRRASSP
jgi:hypothetical protein